MKPIFFARAVVVACALACITPASIAQTEGEKEKRGSIPIGTSKDGSGPADGAIVGGSIQPSITASKSPERDVQRCKELTGVLQEECLRDLKDESPSPPRMITDGRLKSR